MAHPLVSAQRVHSNFSMFSPYIKLAQSAIGPSPLGTNRAATPRLAATLRVTDHRTQRWHEVEMKCRPCLLCSLHHAAPETLPSHLNHLVTVVFKFHHRWWPILFRPFDSPQAPIKGTPASPVSTTSRATLGLTPPLYSSHSGELDYPPQPFTSTSLYPSSRWPISTSVRTPIGSSPFSLRHGELL
jgi:hypothetical protein